MLWIKKNRSNDDRLLLEAGPGTVFQLASGDTWQDMWLTLASEWLKTSTVVFPTVNSLPKK